MIKATITLGGGLSVFDQPSLLEMHSQSVTDIETVYIRDIQNISKPLIFLDQSQLTGASLSIHNVSCALLFSVQWASIIGFTECEFINISGSLMEAQNSVIYISGTALYNITLDS